jgi:hypothetical protein
MASVALASEGRPTRRDHDHSAKVGFLVKDIAAWERALDSARPTEEQWVSTRIVRLCVDAHDPVNLARFWAAALLWDTGAETEGQTGLVPTDGTPFDLLFLPVPEPKAGKNRLHLDLVSESPEHRSEMLDRLVGLGARRIDIGQGDVPWIVLADPEGNEFCVLRPR